VDRERHLTKNFGRSRQGLELRVELAYSGIAEVYMCSAELRSV